MDSLVDGEAEVGEQDVAVLEYFVDRFGILDAIGRLELVHGALGGFHVLRVHNRM